MNDQITHHKIYLIGQALSGMTIIRHFGSSRERKDHAKQAAATAIAIADEVMHQLEVRGSDYNT